MNFKTTKERIIYESLRLFSEKGYDGVSMREIAAAVEIKAASLYAHFDGNNRPFIAPSDRWSTHHRPAASANCRMSTFQKKMTEKAQ